MQELMTFKDYGEFKATFDRVMMSQTEGFVRMGYLLKRARDTDVLYGSGYRSIAEFAWKEYHLRDDVVSRMIAINDRYSEGGYSEQIAERYMGFGHSLLAEMLTLPEEVADALPQGITREEIREVKREIREEELKTPLEVMAEEPDPGQQLQESNLGKMLYRYYQDNLNEYAVLHKQMKEEPGAEEALNALAPNGIGVKMARISGVGKFMLSIHGKDQDLELLNTRTGESESYTWEECLAVLQALCPAAGMKKSWEMVYGCPYPGESQEEIRKPEREPGEVQERMDEPESPGNPERTEGGSAAESGKTREKGEEESQEPEERQSEEPKEETTHEDPESPGNTDHSGEFAPAQMEIGDYPECLPEGYIKSHNGMEVEVEREEELWKEAYAHAERIENTLKSRTWNAGDYLLLPSLLQETREMLGNLEKLQIRAQERAAGN